MSIETTRAIYWNRPPGGHCSGGRLLCLAWSGISLLTLGLAGCEKPPTFSELIHGKKQQPPVPAKTAAVPKPQAPVVPQPAPKAPEPRKRSPQEAIAEFNATPREQRTDRQIAELASTKEAADQFTEMDLTQSGVTGAGMTVLPKFENLEKLTIDNCKYGNDALQNVARMKSLSSLSMKGGPFQDAIHDKGLSYLKEMHSLKNLWIDRARISGEGLASSVGQMDWLETLSLGYTMIGDSELPRLQQLTNLKELNLSGNRITDIGIAALGALPNLEILSLSDIRDFRGQGLLDLVNRGKLKKLRGLSLYDDHELQLPGWEAIRRLRNLEILDVTHSGLNDYYFLNAVSIHPKLIYLGIGDLTFTDQGMKSLPKLKNLRQFHIQGAGITDASLVQIAKLKSLERLSILASSCTEQGVRALQKKLPADCVIYFNQRKLD